MYNVEERNTIVTGILRLMLVRLILVSALLGLGVFLDIRGSDQYVDIVIDYFYAILLAVFPLSLIFLFFLRRVPHIRFHLYLQVSCDILVITALVYATGGIRSTYPAFYPLVIIYAVIFMGREGGIFAASGASILYGLFIDLEFYHLIPSPGMYYFLEYPYSPAYVFLKLNTHIASFYIIAFLAGFVVEREKRVRALLAAKESAFNRLDSLYRSIIESIDAGIITTDLQGYIKTFNRGAEKITELNADDIREKPIGEIFPEVHFCPLDGGGKRSEMIYITREGRKKIIGCSRSSLRDGSGERIGDILIIQDITVVKEMEEAIQQSRKMAFMGEMAATLAHELRNPLASISGSIQLLRKSLVLSESDERLMDIITRGRDQLEGFIRDFLIMARRPALVYEDVNMAEIIAEVVQGVKATNDWNDDIHVTTRLHVDGSVRGNRSELKQIFWNLVINAVQAMPEGGGLLLEMNLLVGGDPPLLEIRVADEGDGLIGDPSRLFEPFYTTRERGTGLGLAIVRKIVEGYGGRVRLEKRIPRGVEVVVEIPAAGPV